VKIETDDDEESATTSVVSKPLETVTGPQHLDEDITAPNTTLNSASGFDPIEFFAPTPTDANRNTKDDSDSIASQKTQDSKTETENDPGQAFLNWLHDGLKQNRFETNSTNARIHCVVEGLLLISPGIFKDFDRENWQRVQKRFQKLKIHRKTVQGTNIHAYQVVGKRSKSHINGILIEEPERLFQDVMLPEPNPHLKPSNSSD
jgi:hypothetical protein